jgi:hypothetical protein
LHVGLYAKPKQYADQESTVGKTLGQPKQEGFRKIQVGNGQAWYYHEDKMLVLWECFFDDRFRKHPLADDANMQKLWQGFERWLVKRFPEVETIATPCNDPIAHSIQEYQTFLQCLDYMSIANAAYGKKSICAV